MADGNSVFHYRGRRDVFFPPVVLWIYCHLLRQTIYGSMTNLNTLVAELLWCISDAITVIN